MPASSDEQFELALATVQHVAHQQTQRTSPQPGDYSWLFPPASSTPVPEPQRRALRDAVAGLDAAAVSSVLVQFSAAMDGCARPVPEAADALADMLRRRASRTVPPLTVSGLRHLVARVASEVYAHMPRSPAASSAVVLPFHAEHPSPGRALVVRKIVLANRSAPVCSEAEFVAPGSVA